MPDGQGRRPSSIRFWTSSNVDVPTADPTIPCCYLVPVMAFFRPVIETGMQAHCATSLGMALTSPLAMAGGHIQFEEEGFPQDLMARKNWISSVNICRSLFAAISLVSLSIKGGSTMDEGSNRLRFNLHQACISRSHMYPGMPILFWHRPNSRPAVEKSDSGEPYFPS